MKEISFDYEIKSVDSELGVMEVMYSAVGQSQHLVSVRMPSDMDALDLTLKQYAPFDLWNQESETYADIQVGQTGSVAAREITYADQRIAAYPNIFDYVDGIVKGDDAQVQEYIDACQAVKALYPKPE